MSWPGPQTRDPPSEAVVILRPVCGHNSIDLLLTGGPFAQSLVAENDVAQYACVLFRVSLGKWRAGSKGYGAWDDHGADMGCCGGILGWQGGALLGIMRNERYYLAGDVACSVWR